MNQAVRRATVSMALVLATTLGSLPAAADRADERDVDPDLRSRLMEAVAVSESFQDRFAAEVWLLDMSTRLRPFVDDPDQRLELLRMIHAEATRADVAPELVLAVIEVESAFDRFAISTAGARGLMQVMPFWTAEIGQPEDNLHDVRTNLRYGCTILKYYLDMADGDLREALARYNGSWRTGQGRRYSDKVLEKLSRRWFRQ